MRRLLKWTFALLLGLPLLAYVSLLLINWNDQPPSVEALEMQRILAERPVPADEDNAYVYLLGILAADGVSPVELGRKRLNWAEAIIAGPYVSIGNMPNEPVWETQPAPDKNRPASIKAFVNSCKALDSGRKPELERNSHLVDEWLESEAWMLQRYQELIALDTSHMPAFAFDIRLWLPPYQYAMEGQRLLLADAWRHAARGESDKARQLLEQDLRFWRMLQGQADTLIERMIAIAAIRQHFQWGRAVIEQGPGSLPAIWKQPLSMEERSLLRTFAGEWEYSNSIFRMIEHDPVGEEQDLGSAALTRLGMPLLQPQDSANRHAASLLFMAERLGTTSLGKARSEFAAHLDSQSRSWPYVDSPYNLMGQILEAFRQDEIWIGYVGRVNDLESFRRASLLLVSAVAEKIPDEGMADYVAGQAELIDPYSEEPFGWDAEKGVLLVPLLQQDEPLALPLR